MRSATVPIAVADSVLPADHRPARCLQLVLGDQLNRRHSWFSRVDPDTVTIFQEVRQETDYVRHHAQKVIAVFAAMRAFARELAAAGHRVHYLSLDDPLNTQHLTDNLDALADASGASALRYQLPDEWRLDMQLSRWAASHHLTVTAHDSEHFLTARDGVSRHFADRRQWLMESFYRQMRQRTGVLMALDGGPEGGQWNYDHDNRESWRGDPPLPELRLPSHDNRALWLMIREAGVDCFGDPQAETMPWPLDRDEALAMLDDFIRNGLPHFGRFQDAMTRQDWRLFHSLLSFALNVKMLAPGEVIAAAEAAWRRGEVSLPTAEGFIRQILGWREYVRGFYWARMPELAEANALGNDLPLPDWFWTGNTRMACLAHAIGQSLSQAYAHHIQRLMVIGNFALLAGLAPAAVHRWYLGVYIDAFEWVELPNTLGMSQFADGGVLATKPYVSAAAYIDRMGDYCKGCAYDRKQRLGPKACPFNALYWDFHLRHESRLRRNPRIGMVYRNIDRMPDAERTAIREQAVFWRSRLDQL